MRGNQKYPYQIFSDLIYEGLENVQGSHRRKMQKEQKFEALTNYNNKEKLTETKLGLLDLVYLDFRAHFFYRAKSSEKLDPILDYVYVWVQSLRDKCSVKNLLF